MKLYVVHDNKGNALNETLSTISERDAITITVDQINMSFIDVTWQDLQHMGFTVHTYIPEGEPVQQVPTWEEMINAWHDDTVIRYPSTFANQWATYTRVDGSRYTFRLVLSLPTPNSPILAVNPYRVESYNMGMPDVVLPIPRRKSLARHDELVAAFESGAIVQHRAPNTAATDTIVIKIDEFQDAQFYLSRCNGGWRVDSHGRSAVGTL